MANNTTTFIIDVVSKGLKTARDGVANLGKSAKDTVASYAATNKAAGGLYNTQAKGVIGTANSTKSFSKLAETMNNSSGIVGAYATLAANIFAVSAAFNALRAAAQVQQVLEGLNASGARTGLTLSVASKRVKELSGDMLSMEQAMRSTSQFMAAGFNTKQLERLTVVAKDTSFALGRNMQDSMDRLTRGIVKLEPELLDELGIMTKLTESNTLMAAKLGKTESQLTSFEKRQGFLNAVLAEGEAKFGGLSKAAGDTTAYDKLASTFSDLVKQLFNMVNVVGKPLAGFLASNKAAIVGLGILLASTISKQLLPGLTNLSSRAKAVTAAMNEQALANLKTANTGVVLGKSYDAVFKKMEKGKAKLTDFTRAQTALKSELDDANFLRKVPGISKKEGLETEKDYQRVLRAQKSLTALQSAYGKDTARTTASNAIDNAATGSTLGGLKQLRQSFTEFSQTTTATGKATSGFAKGMFVVGNSAQFAVTSFLRFLPYIGLIVAGLSILYNLFKTKLTPAQEEYNKKLEAFSAIVDDVNNKVIAYRHIQDSSATAATKAVSLVTLQSNAVGELANSYSELAASAKLAAESIAVKDKDAEERTRIAIEQNKRLGSRSSQGDTADTSRLKVADSLGLSISGNTIKAFSGLVKEGDKDTENLVKTLGGLEKLDPVGFNDFVKTMGGSAQIAAAEYAIKLKIAANAVDAVAKKQAAAKEAIDAVTTAFQSADKAAADFMISSVPTTPFDQLTDGASQSALAVQNLGIQMERRVISAETYGAALSGIGAKFQQIMSVDVSKKINEFNKLDAQVNAFKTQNPNMNKNEQAYLNNLMGKRNIARNDAASTTQRELLVTAKITQQLQEQTRTLDAQVKLHQATLSTVSGIYELNGKGLLERYAQEERIRGQQVQRLKLEMTIHENILAQNDAKIEQLKIEKETLYLRELDRLATERMLKISLTENPADKLRMLMDPSIFLKAKQEADLQAKAIDLQIEGIVLSGRATRAVIANLKNEAAAIFAENLSQAQKIARARDKDFEVSQKYVDMLKEQASILGRIGVTQERLRAISEGNVNQLENEVKLIEAGTRAQKDRLKVEHLNTIEGILRKRAITEADIARARADGNSAAGGLEELRNSQSEVEGRRTLLQLSLLELDNAEKLQIVEKIIFDTRKEGLQWQQESLSYREKELSVAKELTDNLVKNRQLRDEVSQLRRNVPMSQSMVAANELESQIQTYKLAVKEVGMRMDMIDLEYSLLDAQRIALAEELSARKRLLLATTQLTEDSVPIRQINAAISNLGATNVDGMRDLAKRNLRESLEGLRLGLEKAAIPQIEALQGFQKLGGEFAGLLKLQAARRAAEVAATTKAGESVSKVAAIFDNNAVPLKIPAVDDKLKQALPILTQTEQNIAQIAGDVRTMVTNSGQGTQGVAANDNSPKLVGTLYERLSQFKSWAEKQFPSVRGELEHHGGKTGNKRAIDFNVGSGVDWNDPAKKAILTKIAQAAVDAGLSTLWGTVGSEFNKRGVPDHLDHLHVDGKGSGNSTPSTTNTARSMTDSQNSSVTRGVNAEATRINTPIEVPIQINEKETEIVVTGTIKKIEDFLEPVILDISVPPNFSESMEIMRTGLAGPLEELRKLGPQGEAVVAFSEGMMNIAEQGKNAFTKISEAIRTLHSDTATGVEKMQSFQDAAQAALAVASTAVSMISSVVSANADAKVQAIDREIAAEQKRDGKSAESVGKIEALEKKKDAIERKRFNTNKKLQMAQAIINTASGITSALSLPFPMNIIMAGVIGAMGAAQLAIIAGTSYQSTNAPSTAKAMPTTLSIGKRGDGVDVARNNTNVGGELGYLRGSQGTGSNSSNFRTIGSAYGGPMPRGYGHAAFAVGEKGPEVIEPGVPFNVRPMNDNNQSGSMTANFHINAFDGESVNEMLNNRKGDIIDMLRSTANANGSTFLESVNTSHYKKAGGSGASRI